MPFDGLDPSLIYITKFDEVIDLIGNEQRWIKGTERNWQGQYCLKGALKSVGMAKVFAPVVLRSIEEVTGKRYRCIESFNDSQKTTHSEILSVLNRAREHLVAGEFAVLPAKRFWFALPTASDGHKKSSAEAPAGRWWRMLTGLFATQPAFRYGNFIYESPMRREGSTALSAIQDEAAARDLAPVLERVG